MKKWWFLIVAVVIGVCVFGGNALYVWATNRQPTRMTCRQFLDAKSNAKWVELTDCEIDYLGAIQVTSKVVKADKGSFIPVRPTGEEGRAKILLQIDTDEAKKRFERELDQLVGPEGAASQPATMPAATTTVKGLVLSTFTEQSKTRRALEKAEDVDRDFVIIDEGKQPSLADAGPLLILLVLAPLAFILWRRGKSRASFPPAPPQFAGGAPSMNVPPSESV